MLQFRIPSAERKGPSQGVRYVIQYVFRMTSSRQQDRKENKGSCVQETEVPDEYLLLGPSASRTSHR